MEIGEVHQAIDTLLAVDAAALDDTVLHDEVIALHRLTAKLAALRANRVAEWSRRQLWDSDGSTCASARLAAEANMSFTAARDEVRRANALAEMPATAAALGAGSISVGHADRLAHANGAGRQAVFTRDEKLLVDDCVELPFDDAARVIDYWIQSADEAGAEDAATRCRARRGISWRTERDGARVMRAVLDPVAASAVDEALYRIEHDLSLTDRDDPASTRTGRQRRADALVEMAVRAMSTPPGSRRPRPLISILVGEDSFTRTCELAAGTVIAPGQIVALLGDTDIERIIFDAPDRIVTTSTKRTFTGALRRAIEIRDRHCTHPAGCRTPAGRCDIDHIVPVPDGGATSYDNGRVLCPTHNRRPDRRNARPRRPIHQPPDPTPTVSEQISLARQRARTLTRRE